MYWLLGSTPPLCLLDKKDLIFIQNGASLSLRTSHAAHTFPKQAELSAQTFCEISDSCQGCLADSKLRNKDHLWSESMSFILLVPLWAFFWGWFSLSSYFWDQFVLPSVTVWPFSDICLMHLMLVLLPGIYIYMHTSNHSYLLLYYR